VEGEEDYNERLANSRANAILGALPWIGNLSFDLESTVNWDQFFLDVERSKFSSMFRLEKDSVRSLLKDLNLQNQMEPLLEKERYVDVQIEFTRLQTLDEYCDQLITSWNDAVDGESNPEELMNLFESIQQTCPSTLDSIKKPTSPSVQFEFLKHQLNRGTIEPYTAYEELLGLKGKVDLADYRLLEATLFINNRDDFRAEMDFSHVRNVYAYWSNKYDEGSKKRERLDAFYDFEYVAFIHKMQDQRKMRLADRVLERIHERYEGDSLAYEFAVNLAQFYERFDKVEWVAEVLKPYLDNPEFPEANIIYLKTLSHTVGRGTEYLNFVSVLTNAKIYLSDRTWCRLFFDGCGVHYPLLDDERVRGLYCEFCQ
jgi:hypothetical protein